MLTQEQSALLDLMRADNQVAARVFQPGEFWGGVRRDFRSYFDGIGLDDIEAGVFNTYFSNARKNDPRLYEWFLNAYYHLLKQRDVLGIFDRFEATTPCRAKYRAALGADEIQTGTAICIDGHMLSPDFLFTVRDFYNIHEVAPQVATEPVVIAEIGAGWGRLGHLLLSVNPQATFVDFDLPETLLIAATHLPTVLPWASVQPYARGREMRTLDRGTLKTANLWFLGPQDLAKVPRGSIDIFVNVSSFQEMEASIVNAYLDVINFCAEGGVFYTLNMTHGVMSGLADYRFPSRWEPAFNRAALHSADVFEAAFHIRPAPDS